MDARVTEFAAAEAKARFSELLDRAGAGEEIVIRRHGKIVARLVQPLENEVAAFAARRQSGLDYVKWIKAHGPTLGPDLTIKQLIEDGRRY